MVYTIPIGFKNRTLIFFLLIEALRMSMIEQPQVEIANKFTRYLKFISSKLKMYLAGSSEMQPL